MTTEEKVILAERYFSREVVRLWLKYVQNGGVGFAHQASADQAKDLMLWNATHPIGLERPEKDVLDIWLKLNDMYAVVEEVEDILRKRYTNDD